MEYGNKLVWVGCSEFSKELVIFTRYNKLLIALLVALLVGIIIINLQTFILHNKLLEGSAAWISPSNVGGVLVSVIGRLSFA
jgi:hypothetical protein